MLRDNGLGTLPGTAAEILDDEIRHILSANKLSTAQWVEVIRTAHRCGIRTTSTLMYGHAETPAHWVRQMRLLRDIQSETGGFTEFVPLGFVHQNTLLFQQGLARTGPNAGRASQGSCAGACAAGRVHQQHPGFVGEVEPPPFATLPARRRERLRRHVDGRKHFARSRSHRRPVHQPGRFPVADSGDRAAFPPNATRPTRASTSRLPLDEFTAEQSLEAEFA